MNYKVQTKDQGPWRTDNKTNSREVAINFALMLKKFYTDNPGAWRQVRVLEDNKWIVEVRA